jgi:hypothetical protein
MINKPDLDFIKNWRNYYEKLVKPLIVRDSSLDSFIQERVRYLYSSSNKNRVKNLRAPTLQDRLNALPIGEYIACTTPIDLDSGNLKRFHPPKDISDLEQVRECFISYVRPITDPHTNKCDNPFYEEWIVHIFRMLPKGEAP